MIETRIKATRFKLSKNQMKYKKCHHKTNDTTRRAIKLKDKDTVVS